MTNTLERRTDVGRIAHLRIIADHARAATFLINDGVLPRMKVADMCCARFFAAGFVMGVCWGRSSRFSIEMVFAVRDLMQGAYPELIDSAARVAKVVEAEEKQFDRVLKIGLTLPMKRLKNNFTGEKAFHLYETFGLPLDFMVDAARDAGVKFDDGRL